MLGNSLAYASASCLFMAIGGCAVFQGAVLGPQSTQPSVTQGIRHDDARVDSESRKSSPAVMALMKQAEQFVIDKEYSQAAAALERAMRIEPKNPVIYAQLAGVLLVQDQPEQAENLAKRSNSLAGNWPSLQSKNWMTISRSLRVRGEDASADAAEMRAQQYKKLSGK